MADANGMTEAEMMKSLETAEHDTNAFCLREVPALAPPARNELYHGLVPGEVKYCWQFANDDDDGARPSDDERNVWIYFPQLLSLKVDEVVAKYRKHVRVAEAKLNQTKVQEVPEEQLRTFEAVSNERSHSTHSR